MSPQIYRPKQAAELLGIGVSTLWRWAKERKDFPRPVRLSPRCSAFDAKDLNAWVESQKVKQSEVSA